jgi:hypothetical protein
VLGRRADQSFPYSTEVTNEWSYRPTPPYVFTSRTQKTLLHILTFFKILFFYLVGYESVTICITFYNNTNTNNNNNNNNNNYYYYYYYYIY